MLLLLSQKWLMVLQLWLEKIKFMHIEMYSHRFHRIFLQNSHREWSKNNKVCLSLLYFYRIYRTNQYVRYRWRNIIVINRFLLYITNCHRWRKCTIATTRCSISANTRDWGLLITFDEHYFFYLDWMLSILKAANRFIELSRYPIICRMACMRWSVSLRRRIRKGEFPGYCWRRWISSITNWCTN